MNLVMFCWRGDQQQAIRTSRELKRLLPDARLIHIKQHDVNIQLGDEEYISQLSGFGCNHDRVHEFRKLFETLDHFVKVDPDCRFRGNQVFQKMLERDENIRGHFNEGKLSSFCTYFDHLALQKMLGLPTFTQRWRGEDAFWDEHLIPHLTTYNLREGVNWVEHPYPNEVLKIKKPYRPS